MRTGGRSELAGALKATREQTLALLQGLDTAQWQVPQWPTLNPPLWELGHVGWFQEYWCVRRRAGREPGASLLAAHWPRAADDLYDSARVPHAARWALALPSFERTCRYLSDALAAALAALERADESDDGLYFHRLALLHEQMHAEALMHAWHALGYAAPAGVAPIAAYARSPLTELALPGGPLRLGAECGDGFAFDNEQPAHTVRIEPFAIAARQVTNAEYLAFVEDGGYRNLCWWTAPAAARLLRHGRRMPAHWRCRDGQWQQRWFDRWLPTEPAAPVAYVSADEAEAYCRWAGRRLPTEAEWQFAAQQDARFDWGGRTWEWTASVFGPFPGFAPGPYWDYSLPWFGTHRVVRGASFATPAGLVDRRFRNFYRPERTDICIGFRTCAV